MFENVKKFEQALRENKELAEQFAGGTETYYRRKKCRE